FFFQAEDGIRDFHVTGVQTCALPIFSFSSALSSMNPINIDMLTRGDLKLWDTILQKSSNWVFWKVNNSKFFSILISAAFRAVTSNAKMSHNSSLSARILGVPITLTHLTLPSSINILNSWFQGVRLFFDLLKERKKPIISSG